MPENNSGNDIYGTEKIDQGDLKNRAKYLAIFGSVDICGSLASREFLCGIVSIMFSSLFPHLGHTDWIPFTTKDLQILPSVLQALAKYRVNVEKLAAHGVPLCSLLLPSQYIFH